MESTAQLLKVSPQNLTDFRAFIRSLEIEASHFLISKVDLIILHTRWKTIKTQSSNKTPTIANSHSVCIALNYETDQRFMHWFCQIWAVSDIGRSASWCRRVFGCVPNPRAGIHSIPSFTFSWSAKAQVFICFIVKQRLQKRAWLRIIHHCWASQKKWTPKPYRKPLSSKSSAKIVSFARTSGPLFQIILLTL